MTDDIIEAAARAQTMDDLSSSAKAVLVQLHEKPVWDGDLVSKEGRTELVKLGLAQRIRRDKRGLAVNELSPAGLALCSEAIQNIDVAFALAVKQVHGSTEH